MQLSSTFPVMGPHTAWIASLSPWPEEFGLDRMHALLEELGHPERAFPSVHVVGTNGKSTAARTIAQLLRGEGLRVGAYTSPHVSGWEERLDTDAERFERALGRVREAAERVGATQFEALTAAALAEFAAQGVDVAVIEAGLGGRLDARTPSTHRSSSSRMSGSSTRTSSARAVRRSRARSSPSQCLVAIVVLGEPEWACLLPDNEVRIGGAREAAEAFLGRPIESDAEARLPGRLEWRSEGELWDGAHTPEAVEWLLERLPGRDWVIVASMLEDKDVAGVLERLATAASSFVATQSSNPRALQAQELADRARGYVSDVVTIPDPVAALRRAHELGPRVLVTGSLYLLADLHAAAR